MIEQQHLDLLLDLNTDENPHTGGALLDHLRGTHDFLQTWRNDQAVCVGGLFHSIYGTQAYRTESASLDDRQRIRSVIGERAERLAFLFCVTRNAPGSSMRSARTGRHSGIVCLKRERR